MPIKKLTELLYKTFGDTHEAAGSKNFRTYHCIYVAKLARKIAKKLNRTDREIELLTIAALLHDIGKDGLIINSATTKDCSEIHASRSAEFVKSNLNKILPNYLTTEEFDTVVSLIEKHHSESNTILEKILCDADDLSGFGVINIWKMSGFSSHYKFSVEDELEYWKTTGKSYNLNILNERVRLKESREIGREMIEEELRFMDKLKEIVSLDNF